MAIKNTVRSTLAGALLSLAAVTAPAMAQDNPVGATAACGSNAYGDAALSPQTLVKALYSAVSGPAGSKKDWPRLHGLFAPGALVTPTWHGGGFLAAPQTPEQFTALNDRVLGNRDFFERETRFDMQVFGHLAHVWSTFETSNTAGGPARARGVNSFQLLNDGKRWCILSVTWELETAEHPVPAQFAGT